MKRSKRLQPVQDIAARSEKTAMQRYIDHRRRYEEACRQLDELLSYQAEYAVSLRRPVDASLDVARMQQDRQFMQRLGEAVKAQEIVVAKGRDIVEEAKRAWLVSRQRSQSLDTLAENYRAGEIAEAERIEQKNTDELATQRFIWNALRNSHLA